MTRTKTSLAVASFALLAAACGDGGGNTKPGGPVAQALFVAHEGCMASYDIATGEERAGARAERDRPGRHAGASTDGTCWST